MSRSPKFKYRPRTNIILWNSTKFTGELYKYFKIGADSDKTILQAILVVMKNN